MRYRSRVWLSGFLFSFFCVLISSGSLLAQQTTGGKASNAIDQLTGPIALHPDPLVFQILAASTNVDTVKSFAGWMGKNATLKGSELQDAAQKAGFDAPYVALAPFPQVVQMMAQQPEWTKALGQAYTADEKDPDHLQWSAGHCRTAGQSTGDLRPDLQSADSLRRGSSARTQWGVGRWSGCRRFHRGGDHRLLPQLLLS